MTSPTLAHGAKESWQRFLHTYEPLRPGLYRYCRHLARTPWDAEELVQEALSRAYVSLGLMEEPPQIPRAWLFRVASHLWLNRVRQARELLVDANEGATAAPEPRATREAAGTLLTHLAPRERAAIVLKEAFDMPLDEIAQALSTTVGAVKSALHRGREKLAAAPPETSAAPVAPAVLDAFCAAFNARDLDRLTALLLDSTTLEYPGFKIEVGAQEVRAGSLSGTLFGCPEAGVLVTATPHCEARAYGDEMVLLWWSGDEVHAVVRVEIDDEHIARLVNYYHCPEVLEEICGYFGVPFRTHGYRPAITAL